VGGVTITYATLHNEDEVWRKDVRQGDTVIVRRAGDVIPEIVGPVISKRKKGARRWKMPATCNACGTPLVRKEGEADYRCPNRRGCPSQGIEWLFHFAGRGAMDIEHLGYMTVMRLLEKGLIEDPADIDALAAASEDQIDDVPEIGPEIAATVAEWFDESENVQLIEKLRAAGVRLADEGAAGAATGPLEGLSIVLTGGLGSISREEATAAAEAAGARVTSSVSKKTSFVVVGENPGTKLAKAESLGVETIDEQEFLERIGR
jgi:DNA ligase (NAD+)